MFVYAIMDYGNEDWDGSILVSIHETRESARLEVAEYLGGSSVHIIEHNIYGMFDEYLYTYETGDWGPVKAYLLIKMMPIENWEER